MNLAQQDFEAVRSIVRELTGNLIAADKTYLVETRLQPLVAESGCGSLAAFLQHVRLKSDRQWRMRIAQALLITETYFFRESRTLEFLTDRILPDLVQRSGSRPVRLWSAACASGQEVYSLALLVAERFGESQAGNIHITGSDLCSAALEQARQAEYSSLEFGRNLPERFRDRFIAVPPSRWKFDVRRHGPCRFETCNLTFQVLPGPWDAVLLRNVLIYFDDQTRQSIFRRIHGQLAPDGWLILGNSESYQPPPELFRRAGSGSSCFQNSNSVKKSRE